MTLRHTRSAAQPPQGRKVGKNVENASLSPLFPDSSTAQTLSDPADSRIVVTLSQLIDSVAWRLRPLLAASSIGPDRSYCLRIAVAISPRAQLMTVTINGTFFSVAALQP